MTMIVTTAGAAPRLGRMTRLAAAAGVLVSGLVPLVLVGPINWASFLVAGFPASPLIAFAYPVVPLVAGVILALGLLRGRPWAPAGTVAWGVVGVVSLLAGVAATASSGAGSDDVARVLMIQFLPQAGAIVAGALCSLPVARAHRRFRRDAPARQDLPGWQVRAVTTIAAVSTLQTLALGAAQALVLSPASPDVPYEPRVGGILLLVLLAGLAGVVSACGLVARLPARAVPAVRKPLLAALSVMLVAQPLSQAVQSPPSTIFPFDAWPPGVVACVAAMVLVMITPLRWPERGPAS